VNQLITGAQ